MAQAAAAPFHRLGFQPVGSSTLMDELDEIDPSGGSYA